MRRALCLVVFAAAFHAVPAAAENATQLTPDELRAAAMISLETGDNDQAAAMAEALLKRDPDDVDALLLGSRAHRNGGRSESARTLARRAWNRSKTDEQRYASALVMAQALSSGGQRTRAQLWLRRAAQHAPNKRLKQVAVRDFNYVRNRNPLSLNLSFGIAPKSNINNGSANSVINLYGLPDFNLSGAALALSGMEYSSGLSLRYRVAQTSTRATDLTLRAARYDYTLSSAAKALAPAARGSDFAFASVAAGVTRRFINLETRAETTASLEIGKSWYGRKPYSDFGRISLGHSRPLSRQSRLSFNLVQEFTRGPAAPHANLTRLRADYATRVSNGAVIGLSVQFSNSASSVASADYREGVARVSYAPPRGKAGISTSYGLSLRKRAYPSSPFIVGERHDREVSFDMNIGFDKIDYYGFTPTLTLSASQSRSNVGLFDIDNAGISFGIKSAF